MRLAPYLLLTSLIIAFSACNTDDDDPINPCGTPNIVVSAQDGNLTINITPNGTQGFFEVQYGASGFAIGSGTVATVNSIDGLGNIVNGTYDIYVRGNCGGGVWSDWSSPVSFLMSGGASGSCAVPQSFSAFVYSTYVQLYFYQSFADYFEIEYGQTGFTLGTGIRFSSQDDTPNITLLNHGVAYDYYVRANCGGSEWSLWSGVQSFYFD